MAEQTIIFDFPYRITSGYGWRIHPITKKRQFHTGIDFATGVGTHGFSFRPGGIKNNWWSRTGGWINSITYNDLKIRIELYHSKEDYAGSGTKIVRGGTFGLTGDTGSSITGAHVHVEVYEDAQINGKGKITKKGTRIDPGKVLWNKSLIHVVSNDATNKLEEKLKAATKKYEEQLAASAIELEQAVSGKDVEIVRLVKEKNALILDLKDLQVKTEFILPINEDLLAKIVDETIEVDGLIQKWGAFIDGWFTSDTLRGIMKYDVFILIGMNIGALVLSLSNIIDIPPAALNGLLAGAAVVKNLITKRYDTNKDGELDALDTIYLSPR